MTGKEVREILLSNKVNLTWLSERLGISRQGLNTRFLASNFKDAYLYEITAIVGRDLFGIGERRDAQPILNVYAQADRGAALTPDNYPTIGHVSVPYFAGCVGIEYHSEDAAPKYASGDTIFVLPTAGAMMAGGKYLIMTAEVRTIRLAYPSEDNTRVRLSALNTATNGRGKRVYPDLDLPIKDIMATYRVMGAITKG